MANFRRGGRSFQRSMSAPVSWAGFHVGPISLLGTSKVILGSFLPVPGGSHETLTRTIGMLSCAGGAAFGALGLVVVTDVAFAAGPTSVPDPTTEISDDVWPVIVPWMRPTSVDPAFTIFTFDQKGQRKVDEGNRLAVVISNVEATAVTIRLYIRILTKVAVRAS